MAQTLSQAQHTAIRLMKRIERIDPDAWDRLDAYLEIHWYDQVSIEEAIEQMREIHANG